MGIYHQTLTLHRFRKLIGLMGIILPIVLPIGYNLIKEGDWIFKTALSAYYYSDLNVLFVGTLLITGVFLIYYGGYEPEKDEKISDQTWTTLMGVLIITTALVPTEYTLGDQDPCEPLCNSGGIWSWVHNGSAFGFFVMCGWMCITKFTKGDITRPGKPAENRIYLLCGYGIWVVCAGLVILYFAKFHWEHFIIVGEIIVLLLFGAAWNIKGNAHKDIISVFSSESNKPSP